MTEPQFVESSDGTRISYRSSGEGPALVLVHGSGTLGVDWLFVAPLLRERFTVVTLDRRGRGLSGDGGPEYSMQREAEDVFAVMDAVGAEALVGHSYGALCSILAAERSSGLQRLALYEPPIAVEEDAARAIATQVNRGEDELALKMFLSGAVGSPDELEQIRSSRVWPILLGVVPTLPRELDAAARWTPPAGPIDVPTMLLIGGRTEADHYLSGLEDLEQRFTDLRRVSLPGQRHIAHILAPAAFAEVVIDFCA